jgi:transaldolase
LRDLGQSPWLDDISRPMLDDGTFARLIAEDCVSGLTSNPVIFEHAVRQSDAYDADIRAMAARGAGLDGVYERLVEDDIRHAARLLRPVYDTTGVHDGYVSLEVSPHLARDTDGTIAEAERLWRRLDCPNAMIKVPGTVEGLAAIRTLIGRGVNVNVTLLFSPERYIEVANAYMQGLEDRLADDPGAALPHSVASFFLSRIDVMVDGILDAQQGANSGDLRGGTAVAMAQIAYRHFAELTAAERWRSLAGKGAAPQRLLWASTGTKDPTFSDVKYVEPLIAADTVITLPLKTLEAFRDHGTAEPTLTADSGADLDDLSARLARHGVDLGDVLARLEEEGIEKFNVAFDQLHKALAEKIAVVA